MTARTHAEWMAVALEAAQHAGSLGEVPVGAALVLDDRLVATGWNTRETDPDPTGHAELMVLRRAARELGRWRLEGATLYVTLEPCPMCAPALVQARLDRVVFGAYDPKLGAAGSVLSLIERPEFFHRVEVIGGIREVECQELLRAFFARRREGQGTPIDGMQGSW